MPALEISCPPSSPTVDSRRVRAALRRGRSGPAHQRPIPRWDRAERRTGTVRGVLVPSRLAVGRGGDDRGGRSRPVRGEGDPGRAIRTGKLRGPRRSSSTSHLSKARPPGREHSLLTWCLADGLLSTSVPAADPLPRFGPRAPPRRGRSRARQDDRSRHRDGRAASSSGPGPGPCRLPEVAGAEVEGRAVAPIRRRLRHPPGPRSSRLDRALPHAGRHRGVQGDHLLAESTLAAPSRAARGDPDPAGPPHRGRGAPPKERSDVVTSHGGGAFRAGPRRAAPDRDADPARQRESLQPATSSESFRVHRSGHLRPQPQREHRGCGSSAAGAQGVSTAGARASGSDRADEGTGQPALLRRIQAVRVRGSRGVL